MFFCQVAWQSPGRRSQTIPTTQHLPAPNRTYLTNRLTYRGQHIVDGVGLHPPCCKTTLDPERAKGYITERAELHAGVTARLEKGQGIDKEASQLELNIHARSDF